MLKQESGMTLVEIMATIVILGILVTSFTAFFVQAANTTSRSERRAEANYLAQEALEQLVYHAPEVEKDEIGARLQEETPDWTVSGNTLRRQVNDISLTIEIREIPDSALSQVLITASYDNRQLALFETHLVFGSENEGEE